MIESPQIAPKASGLQTVLNTIASPKEAFESLKVAPTWGWAFIIAVVLILIGGILFIPATQHAALGFTQHFLTTKFAANMSDAQKQQMLDGALHPSAVKTYGGLLFNAVVLSLVACALNALFLLIGNAIGKGTAGFKNYFAASVNILIPSFAFAQLVGGIIGAVRGPDGFSGYAELFKAMPSLAWVIPVQHGWALGFLASITIFSIWGAYLNATSLKVMGGVKGGIAWTFAVLILLLSACSIGALAIFA